MLEICIFKVSIEIWGGKRFSSAPSGKLQDNTSRPQPLCSEFHPTDHLSTILPFNTVQFETGMTLLNKLKK